MSITLTLTDRAAQFIREYIVREKGVGFKLGVKKTGCSGYTYAPSVMQAVHEKDVLVPLNCGFSFYVDADADAMLNGIAIDYIEENQMGLKQKRLVYTNPKEVSRCGCGESFNVAE